MKILQIFIMTTTKTNHALDNANSHIESMVNDFNEVTYLESLNVTTNEDEEKLEEIRESVLNSALSVEFRSGWYSSPEDETKAEEFRILLTWGGPALRIIGKLDDYGPIEPKLQFQDWGTPWTDFEITEDQQKALNWFCNCFYFGG